MKRSRSHRSKTKEIDAHEQAPFKAPRAASPRSAEERAGTLRMQRPGPRRLMIAVLTLILLLPRCRVLFDKVEAEAPLETFTDHLDLRIPTLMRRYDIPGVSVALIQDAAVTWTQGYGYTDQVQQQQVRADTIFRADAVAKPVIAWGVMALVERGELGLDLPAAHYITLWALPENDFDTEGVTAHRLLTHSAGFQGAAFPGAGHGTTFSIEDLLSDVETSAERTRLEVAPGTTFVYSDNGYAIVQLIIEEVTGEPFAQYMRRAVLEPLGMLHSDFRLAPWFRYRTATGHLYDGAPATLVDQAAQIGGGLYTTVEDFAHFVAAGLSDAERQATAQTILRSETVAEMYTPQIKVTGLPFRLAAEAYGLGYFIEPSPRGQLISHGGESIGWVSYFYAAPESGDALVILTNSERAHHFVAQIAAMWARWQGLRPPKMSRVMATTTAIARIVMVVLSVWALYLTWRVTDDIAARKRYLNFRFHQHRPRRFIQLGFVLIQIGLLGWLNHAYLANYLPLLTRQLSVTLHLFVGALAVETFSARRHEDAPKATPRRQRIRSQERPAA